MNTLRRTLALVLSSLLLIASFGQAQAAIVSNDQVIHQVQRANDKAALLQTLERTEVQEQLLAMGVSSADVESRIDQMTQQELAQLNQQIDELPAGSGVLGAILLIFIIFVITDVIGATDVFSFIHPVR